MTKEAISTERALRLALEALEYIRNFETEVTSQTKYGNAAQVIEEALASEAIEQSAPATELREQKPVAWMYDWICEGKKIEGWIAHKESEIPRLLASNIRPIYTTPQPAQRQSRSDVKPLTQEEIVAKALHLSGLGPSPDVIQFARAIEAAHGIKENT